MLIGLYLNAMVMVVVVAQVGDQDAINVSSAELNDLIQRMESELKEDIAKRDAVIDELKREIELMKDTKEDVIAGITLLTSFYRSVF